MYCEKCCRVFEGDRCSFCKRSTVRDPMPKDPCYLTELDFISSGILEDVLRQNGIPFLKKGVLGAGLAIEVGPMRDRGRFYVPFERLDDATAIADDLFSAADEPDGEPGADCADEYKTQTGKDLASGDCAVQ